MSTLPDAGRVPEFTLGDRLRKARELTGHNQLQFAAVIGIHRETIAKYETGKQAPRPPVIAAWSMATGVDLNWLRNGDTPRPNGGPGGERSDGAAHQNRTGAYSLLAGESSGWGCGRPLRSIYGPPAASGKAA